MTHTFFSKEDQQTITNAIKNAELNTSGEIRVHIEKRSRVDVLDRAAYLFKQLEMQNTIERNGVLFYLAYKDKKFAILGDAGINKVVPPNFWEEIKEQMLICFKKEQFSQGLVTGIEMAGHALNQFFPYNEQSDTNELSDEISFGKQ